LEVILLGKAPRRTKYRFPPDLRGPEMAKIFKMLKNEKGATAIEYGLIAALIAVAIITAVTTVGTKISTTFNNVSNSL
jgi:pilus assembly protein Flp/PilA